MLDPLYGRVADEIAQHIKDLIPTLAETDIALFRASLRADESTSGEALSYRGKQAALQTAVYWVRNYWKSVYAIADAGATAPASVHDIGAGSGPAAVAAMVYRYLHSDDTLQRSPMTIALTDQSPDQLDLGRALVSQAARFLGLSVQLATHTVSVDDLVHGYYRPPVGEADLVVASHVVAGSVHLARDVLDAAIGYSKQGGTALLIERQHDTTATKAIDDALPALHMPRQRKLIQLPDEHAFGSNPQRRRLAVTRVDRPPAGSYWHYLQLYIAGWQQADLAMFCTAFSRDAEYAIAPTHDHPTRIWRGRSEQPATGCSADDSTIEGYFLSRIARRQRDLVLRTREMACSNDGKISFDFDASFFDVKYSAQRVVEGRMELQTSADGIERLSEAYRARTLTPQRTPDVAL